MLKGDLALLKLGELFIKHNYARDFFISIGINDIDTNGTLLDLAQNIDYRLLEDAGLTREQLVREFLEFVDKMEQLKESKNMVDSITVLGGNDKQGNPENINLEFKIGEVISIVGSTGSGKSRLLADIECLAQRDTPTNRQILLNGKVPDINKRFSIENKLIAQLSQNMNFVMDLTVKEFIQIHAESRMIDNVEKAAKAAFTFYHELAMTSQNTLLPLIYRSFRVPVNHLWIRFINKYGNKVVYNSAKNILKALKNKDKAKAIECVEKAISDSISGSKEIYEA